MNHINHVGNNLVDASVMQRGTGRRIPWMIVMRITLSNVLIETRHVPDPRRTQLEIADIIASNSVVSATMMHQMMTSETGKIAALFRER